MLPGQVLNLLAKVCWLYGSVGLIEWVQHGLWEEWRGSMKNKDIQLYMCDVRAVPSHRLLVSLTTRPHTLGNLQLQVEFFLSHSWPLFWVCGLIVRLCFKYANMTVWQCNGLFLHTSLSANHLDEVLINLIEELPYVVLASHVTVMDQEESHV